MAYSYDRDNVARADPGPADDMFDITPGDSENLAQPVRALRVGGAGDLHVITRSGSERTIAVLDGEVITCGILKVFATGTTATGLLGYV
jgi:hypothetical protein